jgi:hypothetical protein
MQGNWWILLLLALAVVIYALARVFGQREEDGEADPKQSAGMNMPGGEPGAPDGITWEPDGAADGDAGTGEPEVPWAECQRQLVEAPPIDECDWVEFESPGEAEDEIKAEPETEIEVEPVPESGHAVNAAIRRKAGRLLRENYRRILPLSAAFAALTAVRILHQHRLLLPEWATGCFGPADIFTALIEPMVALGAAYAAVRLWKGEVPRLGMLIHFLRERRFFPALGLTLIKLALLALPMIAMAGGAALLRMLVAQAAPEEAYRVVQLANSLICILLLLVLCATAWLTSWLEMAGFAMARAPERGAIAAIKAGFRTGNRRFGHVLGMLVAAGWPFGVVRILQYIGTMWSAWLKMPVVGLATEALNLMLILFYGGYFLLSMAGLAERLTPEEGEGPRTEADPPCGGTPREAGNDKAQAVMRALEDWLG